MRKILSILLVTIVICLSNTALADEKFLEIKAVSEGLAAVQSADHPVGIF